MNWYEKHIWSRLRSYIDNQYVTINGETCCLDGDFTIEQLEKIIEVMKFYNESLTELQPTGSNIGE